MTATAVACELEGCPCACHRPLPLATRSMKARRAGTCPLCLGPIMPGQRISKVVQWAHDDCIRRQRQAAAGLLGQLTTEGTP